MPPIVALGGSAGSLDALIKFFALMPRDCGVAFIVAVHVLPNEQSNLPQLLQRRCALRVSNPRNDQRIAANSVYVIPPGRVLTCVKNRLRVAPLEVKRGTRSVIDTLFNSLAMQTTRGMAAIMLSGADSDGATGLKRIKEAGGLALVQDPAEASQAVMPTAGIATNRVDAILPVAEMPARLLHHFGIKAELRSANAQQVVPPLKIQKMTVKERAQVRQALVYLREQTERDFSCYRETGILHHLKKRMAALGGRHINEYLKLLRTDPAEAKALARDFLVSYTCFFRDPETFNALVRFIPECFKGKGPEDFVRVWVPACASGQEAYSVAMLLMEHSDTVEKPPGLQVFGCDLDSRAIEKARKGLYSAEEVRAVGPERLARFFSKAQGGYRVRRELRQIVLFAVHDVVRDSGFSRMDMVTCRNLLIHLDLRGQERMMGVFAFALRPAGLLFLGASEGVIGLSAEFDSLDLGHRIYIKRVTPTNGTPRPAATASQQAVAVEMRAHSRERTARARARPGVGELHEELELLQRRLNETSSQSKPGAEAFRIERLQLEQITQELHAVMEELDLNRQELRSMNTELSAVNAELSSKLDQVERMNSDLTNLMNATAIPTVFLDRELCIMRFTPVATRLFPFTAADVGRPLVHLRHNLQYRALLEDLQQVLANGEIIEKEVCDDGGHWYLSRVLPYRTAQQEIAGVALTFFDITARKRAEADLQTRNDELERFGKTTVGRELRMIELKKEVNTLLDQQGKAVRYPLAFESNGNDDENSK
jgi:chemotaxis methyl-accepting protein methylase/PAS domain-containing protein